MPNYRRLISYIYAYEGGVKGKNIGFAKIESRGVQCRITVNVKKVYVGSNDTGVYLLAGEQEIFLGNIFIRGGSGEFFAVVSSASVENSGLSIEDCFGLTVHDVENTWRSYTTIWEDAVAHAAEMELADSVSLPAGLGQEKETRETGAEEEKIEDAVRQIAEEFPMEPPREEKPAPEAAEEINPLPMNMTQKEPEEEPVAEMESQAEKQREPVIGKTVCYRADAVLGEEAKIVSKILPAPAEAVSEISPAPLEAGRKVPSESSGADPKSLKASPENAGHDGVWQGLRHGHTRLTDFDYEKGCEILTVKPQDIGLLPREAWGYGNNSFLLHGYYHYRYLILAKLNNPEGTPRYLLGVPGHYYSNESYMAAMFGFPNFVLSKDQPKEDGRFGYWYTDIRLDAGEETDQ